MDVTALAMHKVKDAVLTLPLFVGPIEAHETEELPLSYQLGYSAHCHSSHPDDH